MCFANITAQLKQVLIQILVQENTCSGTGTGIGKFNLYINTSHINLLTIPDGDATLPSSDGI
jgi:hypothetical protein